MAITSSISDLSPLDKTGCQAYFSNSIQIADVMAWALDQIGKSDVLISTFSTSEEFIRRVVHLKLKGLIGCATLFCDIRAARKTLAIYNFIHATFDEVYLCENHSKVIIFTGGARQVAIVTSQNQTRGDRYECGVILTMADKVSCLYNSLNQLKSSSRPLNELISGTI